MKDYILDVVWATREPERFGLANLKDAIDFGGPGRRCSCIAAARAHAFLRHRGFVTPEDVKAVGMDVPAPGDAHLRGRGRGADAGAGGAAGIRQGRGPLGRAMLAGSSGGSAGWRSPLPGRLRAPGRAVPCAGVRDALQRGAPYQAGDVVPLDWNVTARTSAPHVKVFTEERELTVVLLVDVSASEEFGWGAQVGDGGRGGGADRLLRDREQRPRGAPSLLDRVEKVIPPRKGRKHVLRLVSDILSFRPAGKGTDLSLALGWLSRVTKRRTVLFVVSDFPARAATRPRCAPRG